VPAAPGLLGSGAGGRSLLLLLLLLLLASINGPLVPRRTRFHAARPDKTQ